MTFFRIEINCHTSTKKKKEENKYFKAVRKTVFVKVKF